MRTKKAQVSVELMIVIGFILIFFIPLLLISYFKIIDINHDLASIQAEVAVNRLAHTIDSVGRMGLGSSIFLDIYFPLGSELKFENYDPGAEIILELDPDTGINHAVANSWFNIEFSLQTDTEMSGGNYRFNITSIGDGKVSVTLIN